MSQRNKIFILSLFIFVQLGPISLAQEAGSFTGEVNNNNINVRSDSTVSARVICNLNKNERVEIVSELYDWYKIRLPKTALSFVKKDLVMPIDEKTAKVLKDNVNIRLNPNESSVILGRVSKNEVVDILEDRGDWYKIEPVNNSFGWIHKKFVNKLNKEVIELTQGIKGEKRTLSKNIPAKENIVVEGIIRPKIITRIATHKLIGEGKTIFLLKGKRENLNVLNFHKVKIIGKLITTSTQGYSVIEITAMEALN